MLRHARTVLGRVVSPGDRLLAALSGGADSTALVLVLHALAASRGVEVAAAVIDHGLREGSGREAERVAAWARAQGLVAHVRKVSVGKSGGREAAAREARYAALHDLAQEQRFDWILTGHTASDQAETVLLRLGRGAGARGARGVLERRGTVLRPLLGVTRPQILAFLQSRGQGPLVEDPTNADLSLARNRIRHRVLPELRLALGPGADRALARFARLARDDEAALQHWASQIPNDRAALRALPPAVSRRWLRALCEGAGYRPNAADLESLRRGLRGEQGREIELARAWVVRIAARVTLYRRGTAARLEPLELHDVGRVVAWGGWELALHPGKGPRSALALRLPRTVSLPLRIRPVEPGDRLQGERGTVRVKRLLIDRKVPRAERAEIPVVTDAQGTVLWVVGHRVAAPLHAHARDRDGWVLTFARRKDTAGERSSKDRVT